LPRFAAAFEAVARSQLSAAALLRTFETDGALAAGELSLPLVAALRAEVWGQGFPAPVFDDVFEVSSQRVVGGRHLRIDVERGGERFAAIVFGQAEALPARIRAAYRPDVNGWNGRETVELVIEHWAPEPLP
jgi:single-stranded-DNA-specific exonuclease